MMEMDDRDSAKCRKSKIRDIYGIIEFVLNDNNAKIVNTVISYKLKRRENVKGKGGSYSRLLEFVFRERRTSFSLDSRAIGQLKSFGPRRKGVLRGEAYPWTPIS